MSIFSKAWDQTGGKAWGAIGNILGYGAAGEAAQAQKDTSIAGINEQRRQFDLYQQLLAPYIQGGTNAFQQQQNLIGLGTPDAQQQAIDALQNSPEFQAMQQQGESAILQNASATGGLRGGNTQAALAQFRPQMLNDLINQQYARLGGMATLGQNSAAGQGAQGMNMASNVGNLLTQYGAAKAGGILGDANFYRGLIQEGAQLYGAAKGGMFS